MVDREKVIDDLEEQIAWIRDNDFHKFPGWGHAVLAMRDALALLKAQEQRHRLEVHNIGNVDIPEGVTWEQFQAVMSGVVKALEHTDRGESWPYDEDRR